MRKLEIIRDGDIFKDVQDNKYIIQNINDLWYMKDMNTNENKYEGMEYDLLLVVLRYDTKMTKIKYGKKK